MKYISIFIILNWFLLVYLVKTRVRKIKVEIVIIVNIKPKLNKTYIFILFKAKKLICFSYLQGLIKLYKSFLIWFY